MLLALLLLCWLPRPLVVLVPELAATANDVCPAEIVLPKKKPPREVPVWEV